MPATGGAVPTGRHSELDGVRTLKDPRRSCACALRRPIGRLRVVRCCETRVTGPLASTQYGA